MTDHEYAAQLGGLLANFHSLEFLLRGFLYKLPGARQLGLPYGTDMYSLPVGTELSECTLTDYDTLGGLIDKFNKEMRKRGQPTLDRRIVDVRDAIAHGRVSADAVGVTFRLLKFNKPANRRVRIVFNEQLTMQWFKVQKTEVRKAITYVHGYIPP